MSSVTETRRMKEHMAWVRSHRKVSSKKKRTKIEHFTYPAIITKRARSLSLTHLTQSATDGIKAVRDGYGRMIDRGREQVKDYLDDQQRQAMVMRVHRKSSQHNPDIRRNNILEQSAHPDLQNDIENVAYMLERNKIARTSRQSHKKKPTRKSLTWRNQSDDSNQYVAGIANVREIPARGE